MRAKLDALLSQAITAAINWAVRNRQQGWATSHTDHTGPKANWSDVKPARVSVDPARKGKKP